MSERPSLHPAPEVRVDRCFLGSSLAVTLWTCGIAHRRPSPEHAQSEFVLAFPHAGSFVLHTEGRSDLIDEGSVALFNAGVPYRTSHPHGCGDRGSTLVVPRKVLADILSDWDPGAPFRDGKLLSVAAVSPPAAYWRQRLLVARLGHADGVDPLEAEETALGIVRDVLAALRLPRRGRAPRAREIAEDARSHLRGAFPEPLRLAELSARLRVSPFQLCRAFRAHTGMPLHRYRTSLRLKAAIERLAGADLAGLAFDLGFASHSHFTSAFRREFGVTPSAARRLLARGGRLAPPRISGPS